MRVFLVTFDCPSAKVIKTLQPYTDGRENFGIYVCGRSVHEALKIVEGRLGRETSECVAEITIRVKAALP
jgi:hypothetical protein